MAGYGRAAIIGAMAAALGLAMPAAAQWTGQYQPVKPGKPVDLAPGAAMPPGLLKRTRKDDVSGSTKVVIPFFQVQFVTASKASSNRSFASLSQAYTLEGLSQADMQTMADTLYDRFVAGLTAKGLTVIPLDQAKAQSPALVKLLAAAKPAPFEGRTSEGTTSAIVSAHGVPVYFHIGDPQLGSMANIGSRAYWDQPAAAKELGATLVGVRIGMNFVEQASSDKRGLLGIRSSTAKVTSDVTLSIEPVTTHVWIQSPKATSSIVGQPIEPVRYYLTSPLVVPDGAILSTQDTTTRGQKRSDVAASVVGSLLGGISRNSTKAYTVTVDPARFRTDVGGAMATVDGALADQVAVDLAMR